jgi:hypothetical protein
MIQIAMRRMNTPLRFPETPRFAGFYMLLTVVSETKEM